MTNEEIINMYISEALKDMDANNPAALGVMFEILEAAYLDGLLLCRPVISGSGEVIIHITPDKLPTKIDGVIH